MQYISGRKISQNFGIPGITTNDTVVNVTGRVAVGIDPVGLGTSATADVDLNTIRIRNTILDYEGKDGEFGYYLVRDAEGIAWVAVPPIDSNAIFVSQDENIVGVSSFTGLNFVSKDNFFNIVTNSNNTSFADVNVDLRWFRDRVGSGGGIYTTGVVGIGSTIPITSAGILTDIKLDIDGDVIISGILSAKYIVADFEIDTKNLKVTGVSTFVGLATFTKVGIGTTDVVGNDILSISGDVGILGEQDVFRVGNAITMSSGIVTAIEFDGIFLDFDYLNVSIASTLGDAEARTLEVTGISTFKDHVELEKTLKVAGVSTFVGLSTFTEVGIGTTSTVGDNVLSIVGDVGLVGENNVLRVGNAITMSSGIITAREFDGIFLDLDYLNVSIASTLGDADASSLEVTGISTFKDHVELEKTLKVAGISTFKDHVELEKTLKVAGVSTFVGLSTFTEVGIGTADVIGNDVLTIVGDVGLVGENNVLRVGNAITMSSGIITAIEFDGTNLDFDYLNVSIASTLGDADASSLEVTGVSTFKGHLELEKTLEVTGVSTFKDHVELEKTLKVAGVSTFKNHVELEKTLEVTGLSTFSQGVRIHDYLVVHKDVSILGNITIGGTSAIFYAEELKVTDKDIIVGYTTNLSGNEVSNDLSSSGGGIAVASTEGSPLVSLKTVGISDLPDTYKKFVWFEAGSFQGLGTDAWLSNYAIGIGSTQIPNKVQFAVGNIQLTDSDIINVRNINSQSGIVTVGNIKISSGVITSTSGKINYYGDLIGIAATASYATTAFSLNGIVESDLNVAFASSASYATTAFSLNGIVESDLNVAYASSSNIANTIGGGATGNVLYQSSTDSTNFIPNGSDGQVLLFNGTIPYWGNVSSASDAFGGISIYDEGTLVGTPDNIIKINFVSPNLNASASTGSNGIATVTLSDDINISSLNVSGVSTLGKVNISSGIITATSGIVTYYGNFIGNLTGIAATASYATTAFSLNGVLEQDLNVAFASSASYATTAFSLNGVLEQDLNVAYAATASYATTAFSLNGVLEQDLNVAFAETSKNVIGGIASITSLNVSGISTLGNVQISTGIITAVPGTQQIVYYGDGSKLQGVTGVKVELQTSVSDPVYPTLASSTGVNTIGITTTGLVFINNTNSLGVGTNNPKANLHVVGSIETDDINTGSGKFNTNISHSVYTTPTGVLTPIITFPGTSGKRYIVHSINVANVARVQPQGASATVGINTLAGAVTSVTIDGVGVGYTDGDIGSPTNLNVSFATTSYVGVGTIGDPAYSGITSALGYITSVSGGAVTGVAITFNGFGYTSPPVVTFAPPIGGGTTETGTSVLTYGEVNAVYLNSLGEGYKTAPEVTIQSELGVGAKITSEVDNDGRVIGLNIISRGYGYSRNNSLGNNEENEVYIDLPPLAKTEVGVDVEIDRYPVGGGTTVSSYLAFDVPIPVGGVLEVLKQPAVMNPGDILKMRGIDSEGSGLDDAIDVSICYEETNDNYIGYGTATPANIGIGTEILNIGIISATTNPVLLQSLRLTNTEFVGDYDVSIKVVTGAGQTYYLARNLVIPSFSSIELFDAPKRIEAGSYLLMDAETVGVDANEASTIDIQVSGKRII